MDTAWPYLVVTAAGVYYCLSIYLYLHNGLCIPALTKGSVEDHPTNKTDLVSSSTSTTTTLISKLTLLFWVRHQP